MAFAKVDRSELLRCLHAASPGLSPAETVQQSSAFLFRRGWVFTYNDEVSARVRGPLPEDITAAVSAAPLLKVLSQVKDEEVGIDHADGFFVVRGKGTKVKVRAEAEVLMQLDKVERPGGWQDLHVDFTDAIKIVQDCRSTDKDLYRLQCIHVHPDWIEASDNLQAARFTLKTGFPEPVLVRQSSLKHVVPLDVTEFSLGKSWVHFRNPGGLTLSLRLDRQEFPNITRFLEARGEPATLPKGMVEAAALAGVFSAENKDDDKIMVELRPGEVTLFGEASSGEAEKWLKINYDGPPLSFRISPNLLSEIVKRNNDCEISSSKLRVDGGKWVYMTVLGKPKQEKNREED